MASLERYHSLEQRVLPVGELYLKAGVAGYPDPPPALQIFTGRLGGEGPLLDASGTAGGAALDAMLAGSAVEVLEPSAAALRCARATLDRDRATVRAGLPWGLDAQSIQRLALAPPAHKGNARVRAELRAASSVLPPDGVLYLALHKDQGARRYERLVAELFEDARVIARDRGWRLTEARRPRKLRPGDENVLQPWLPFSVAGLELEALAGVYAAGKLDPGTALLSETIEWAGLLGRRVLDLGCGYGLLALQAALAGAAVTAVDDDLAAVHSTSRNAARHGVSIDVRHSDVDSELSGEHYQVVVSNPPFHVGRGVRLVLPEAFTEAARSLLVPGGELWLVANRDLPYERFLAKWTGVERVADAGGFKVLRAVK